MSFKIRPAHPNDLPVIVGLATSLAGHGFLTLPATPEELTTLLKVSERSFRGECGREGQYLFVLESLATAAHRSAVIGISLINARHGTPDSPHLYFEVDREKQTLKLCYDTVGRTELGGLFLDPRYRGHPQRLGKRLSLVRLHYIHRHPERFLPTLLAELLPPFLPDGRSALWEAVGGRLTKMSYPAADRRSRHDKEFVRQTFPSEPIPITTLPPAAQRAIGELGPTARHAAKILSGVGFRYLFQVDPFDGGPHYGAWQDEIDYDTIERFLLQETTVTPALPGATS